MELVISPNQPLVTSKPPVAAYDLTNKEYVDQRTSEHSDDTGLHLSISERIWISNVLATYTEINYLTGVTSGVQSQMDSKLSLSGGNMLGNLSLFGNPSTLLHAVNKGYADAELAKKLDKTGGVLTGYITLHAAPTADLHASSKKYVDDSVSTHSSDATLHVSSTQKTWLNQLTVSSIEANYLSGVTSSIQTQINNKLSLSGGTLTGGLILNGSPTVDLHAATKKYVDDGLSTKLNLSGGTLTGYLRLVGSPVDPADAVSLAYLNDRLTGSGDFTSAMLSQKLDKTGGTMTGYVVLHADPATALQAATKQYVDNSLTTHANNATLHLTTAQNTWLDAVTATFTEVNYLSGVTSAVQTQLNSKLPSSGGTLTGALILNGAPTLDLHASTKKYVDDGLSGKLNLSGGTLTGYLKIHADPAVAADAVSKGYLDNRLTGQIDVYSSFLNSKLDKSGGSLTGYVVLHADPTLALHPVTKQYADTALSTHTSNTALHLTTTQNTWLDAITATAGEVNYLSGVTSNLQTQISNKFDKTGGVVNGDITLASGYGFFTSKAPTLASELVNKAYVDQMVASKKFLDPIICSNLISFTQNTPPASPVDGDCYIVGASPTGVWVGLAGRVVTRKNSTWVSLQSRTVAVGDRFGVSLTGTAPDASLSAYNDRVVTVTVATVGSYQFTTDPLVAGSSTLVYDPEAFNFGDTVTYIDEGNWVVTNTSVNLVPMNGLVLSGKYLSIGVSPGLTATQGVLSLNIDQTKGLAFNGSDQLYVKLDSTTLTQSANGIKLNDSLKTIIDKAMTVDGVNTVTGQINVGGTGQLRSAATPTVATDVITKSYADGINTILSGLISALTTTVNSLNSDPVSKSYTDAELAKKLNLAGGTLTGALVLNGAPTIDLHASTKKYVDDGLNTKLNLSGGTLTGYLKIHADPAGLTDAVSKGYLDNRLTGISDYTAAMLNQKLDKVGGTLTGFLTLHADPVNLLHTATKQYVDNSVTTHTNDNTIHVTSGQKTWLSAITASAVEVNYLGGLASSVQTQLNNKLSLAGGTLTGVLVLNGAPTLDLHASTKKYVDDGLATKLSLSGGTLTGYLKIHANPAAAADAVSKGYLDDRLNGQLDVYSSYLLPKLDKSGGTMTGYLVLHADPTLALHPATKQYTDTVLSTHAANAALHLTSTQNTWLDAVTATATEVNYLAGVTSAVQTQLNNKLPLSGGSLTSFLTLHADPVNLLHAVTKQYVDASVSTHTTDNTIHVTSGQKTWLGSITSSAAEVNFLGGVSSSVQTQLNNKLSLAGGTLTGALILNAAPTIDLHASTKKYVDDGLALKLSLSGGVMTGYLKLAGNPVVSADAVSKGYLDDRLNGQIDVYSSFLNSKLDKSGGTMTGYIVLHADPTSAFHSTTKQYVDNSVTTLSNATSISVGALQTRATNLETTVGVLNTDPVTKTYTDTQLNTKLNLSGGTMTGYIALHADPVSSMQPTTKQYVDNYVLGLKTKESVRLATTANLSATYSNGSSGVNATLTGTANGALSVDGKTVSLNDRILVRLQTASLQNGDYTTIQVGNAGAPFILRRTSTMDELVEISGAYFNVFDGNTLKGTGWVLTVTDPTTFVIGTDAVTVNQFFGPGAYIGGDGLLLSGNTFSIGTASSSRIVVNSDNIDLATTGVTAGTYRSVTVDAYGRTTGGTNPTTLSGYGITDAPTLTGTGASGTWLINITGNSGTTDFVKIADTRSTNPTPQSYGAGIKFDFKQNSVDGLSDSGTYHGVMTIRQYASGSDWSGGGVRQLGFTDNHNLWIRGANADTTWSAWLRFLKTSDAVATNTANMVVARDASGNFAAGTITANLTGTASTASVAVTPTLAGYLGDYTLSDYNSGVAGGLTARYGSSTGLNKPTGTDHSVLTLAFSTIWATQMAGDWRTNQYYMRALTNGVWTSWVRLLKADETDSANTVDKIVRRDASGNFATNVITATTVKTSQIESTAIVTVLNAGVAQGMKLGSLVVSSSYSDTAPTYGAYIKGQIQSGVATGTAPLVIASTTLNTNLNADLLDGLHASTANTPSTVVSRDATGNFSANVITASLATYFLSTSTMNLTSGTSGIYRNENGLGGNYAYAPVIHIAAGDTMWQATVSYNANPGDGTMKFRQGFNGNWGNWLTVLSSANYNNYSPTLTGTGASGTWGIGVSGNAGTATVLQNARNFNITGDISAPAVSFNGSGNVTLVATLPPSGVEGGLYSKVFVNNKGIVTAGDNPTTLAGYGITDAPTLTGTGATGTWGISVSGNAGTATILQNARTINGVSFNGSANINILTTYDSNYSRINQPGGGVYTGQDVTKTGAIAIRLPTAVYTNSLMLKFEVEIYDFANGKSFTIVIAGYQSGGSTWSNVSAYSSTDGFTDRRFNVRFGKDTTAGRFVVYIGELASTWAYPQIFVKNVVCGYSSDPSITTGWTVDFEATAFANVGITLYTTGGYSATSSVANSLVYRDASGNFAANIITASLVGNASTAVALYNPRTINGVSFNGTANINLPGYDNTYRRLMRPEGASFEGNGSQTGAIAIRLPFGWTNTMIRMTIRVYNYAASGSCDIHLGGYTYVGLYWVNTYVNISSNPGSDVRYRVRFGYTAGGKCVIYIAEESSVWSYLKVEVVDVYIGHSNNTVAWETGWSVYLESAAAETVSMAWNADTTCSTYATYANTANALVKRDASGWIDVAAVKTAQIRNDSYIGLYTTSGAAQAIKVSSLVVSNNYADGAPTNGAYVKGQIASGVTTGTAPFTIASTTVSANLNADLLDGYHANTTNAANTVVARDGSGNFAANAITLAGDPTTALQAATKQYIDNKLPYCKGLNEASGDVDPNTTALHVILSNHANTPGLSSYWHITTTFYESISSTANRGQIAVQYNNGGAAYVRSHYAGAWTSWVRMDNSITTPVSATSGGTLVSAINSASLQVMGDATNGAFMSFNRLGVYALNMGIDIDNVFKIGGWSAAGGTPMSLTGTGNLQAKLSVTLPAEYSIGNITGATTINFANGQKARATLTGNVTFTFSFPGVGMYLLVLVQDATGNRTVTYPGGTKYVGSATAPAINTTASSETMLNVYWSGTAVYVGGSKVNA